MPVRATSMMRSKSSSMTMGETPGGGFVEHQDLGLGHQRAADGDLLALAAGELARRLPALVLEDREEAIDLLHRAGDVVAAEERAHLQVLLHRHRGEDVRCLGDEGHALGNPVLRREMRDVVAADPDGTFAEVQHSEDGFHCGGFARAVGADDDGDFAFVHGDGAVVQDVGAVAAVSGPRSMTAGLDLEGRAFLHDYDASTDPHGRVLETIMTAPLVVGHWISAQYYFSTVDPERFGAGDKLLHNPIGATGVLTGEGGDLRVGLPLQSTHVDGRRYHQPVRLLAIIQADLEQIESTIAANPVLQSLTSGSWLRIAGRSHPHEPWSMRTPEGTWIATPRDLDAVHVRPEQMETT